MLILQAVCCQICLLVAVMYVSSTAAAWMAYAS